MSIIDSKPCKLNAHTFITWIFYLPIKALSFLIPSILLVTLVVIIYKSINTSYITVLPISVPQNLSEHGFKPEVFSARVRSGMSIINRKATTSRLKDKLKVTGKEDEFDIQLPGQPFSLNTLARITKKLLGIEDVVVNTDITIDRDDYIAEIRINGGSYDGSVKTVRWPIPNDTNEFVFEVARMSMCAVSPTICAKYEVVSENERCRQTPPCKYDKALAVYERMLSSPPYEDDKFAFSGRAAVEYYLGEYQKAVEDTNAAIDLDPKYAAAYSNLGIILIKLGRNEEAIEKIRKSIELDDPKESIPYSNWGLALSELGRYEEALVQ